MYSAEEQGEMFRDLFDTAGMIGIRWIIMVNETA